MANPGLGYRTVFSLLMEISLHLVEPLVDATLLTSVAGAGAATVNVSNTENMFPGAPIIVDAGTAQAELVIPSAIGAGNFTATFAQAHAVNAPILGVTFPSQINTDPLWTVPEVLNYISRAQNEFLARVPSYYLLVSQLATYGQIIQKTDCIPIQIERVAASTFSVAIQSLTRANGVVTVVTQSPHTLGVKDKFSILFPPTSQVSFGGAFQVATLISPTSFTFVQSGPNETVAAGGSLGLLLRLYELTQESLTQANPGWQNLFIQSPASWFEDRLASYQWGLNGKPATNFPIELLLAIRDTDSLGQMDGFLVPDILVHFVKYKALQYCWDKDGEQRNPRMAQFCGMRFDRGIGATRRWVAEMMAGELASGAAAAGRRKRVVGGGR